MKTVITLAVCVLLSLSLKAQTKEVTVKDSSGNILEIGYLNENDERDSVWVAYNDKGVVISEMEYKDGKKVGTWRMYNDNGRIIFKVQYVNDKKRKGKQWDDKGRLIDYRIWDCEEHLICETIRKY
jgi:antitoxin component YwqK of YwqJK toxin-antitoxin module